MKILFERRPGVYLPEIAAYRAYCARNLPEVQTAETGEERQVHDPEAFDVVWRFMGMDRAGTGRRVIHEYNSLSTGRWARVKNSLKKGLNSRPTARIFLNDQVREGFSFSDNVPFRCRDMGVDQAFFAKAEGGKPEYDFVYAGSLDRGAIIRRVLAHFRDCPKTGRLLVIGSVPDDLYKAFKDVKSIIFAGRIPYVHVPHLMSQARYGLNLMPDCYPLNLQTATKVLEYCAVGLSVVTTDYRWVRAFERTRGASFFYLMSDVSNLTLANLENHAFHTPSVEDLEWDKIIGKSGVFDLL